MAGINPYEPSHAKSDRDRSLAWLTRLSIYAVLFNLSWDASVGTPFLLRWLNRTQPDLLFQIFVAAVIAIPIYLIGHLMARSHSNAETLMRSIVAGFVFGTQPTEVLRLEELPRMLSQYGFNFASVLYREQSHWLFDMLIALLAEFIAVALVSLVYRSTSRRTALEKSG
ncbi:hypothetical protein LF1_00480 [Rubripirellula obstinata]|uniref:Uncharacterized protein n=1 Tax=Rubripirellula obstinata TaxID=406547 RepID=A0A5B1CBF4_9BACT|nr:hypothetical protein [Rubripirellula obstinata]KAA1257561.1 hypothetical protein LF1_00480 [Rubripirellula obstinata]